MPNLTIPINNLVLLLIPTKLMNSRLSILMRARSAPFYANAAVSASRGGHFHRPDPKPYSLYKYTRRTHLEDINTVLYSDFAPEFHMHLHSI
jgi:hypothetical protein